MSRVEEIRSRLVDLYAQIADHTKPECTHTCRLPHSCCDPHICEMVIKFAKERWGLNLERTTHAKLPLMGRGGCTAPPFARPICSVHTCQVNSLGGKVTGDTEGDLAWTLRYFELRNEIDELEWKLGEQTVIPE